MLRCIKPRSFPPAEWNRGAQRKKRFPPLRAGEGSPGFATNSGRRPRRCRGMVFAAAVNLFEGRDARKPADLFEEARSQN